MLPLPVLILGILSLFFPAIIRAEVISASLGTGLKADGSLAEINSSDVRWSVRQGSETEGPAIVGPLSTSWIPAGLRGQWIHSQATVVGRYTYRTSFHLEFPETSTPRLQLRLAADDAIYSVRVNGENQLNSITGFDEVDTVIVEKGLLPGVNDLEIIVHNLIPGPTGLWCEAIATHTPLGAEESLKAALVEDNLLKVSWPVRDPAFSLTYNPTLDQPLWTPVTAQPDLIGDEFSLKFPTEPERGFYRLVKPENTKPPVTRITVNPTDPSNRQAVYLASNGDYTGTEIYKLSQGVGGTAIPRFDAGDSFDPRGGNLSYDWKIFYPADVHGGAEFTGAGLSGTQASVLEIGVNTLPNIGSRLWRARLTVTSEAGGKPLSRVAEFSFNYSASSTSAGPVPAVVVVADLHHHDPEEVSFAPSCPGADGCTLSNSAEAAYTHVFDASTSSDPRGGTLSYVWEIRYPTSLNGGGVYTHPGLVVDGPVVTLAPNSLPDIGSLNYRVRLTVISTLPDGSVQWRAVKFRFQYADSDLALPPS